MTVVFIIAVTSVGVLVGGWGLAQPHNRELARRQKVSVDLDLFTLWGVPRGCDTTGEHRLACSSLVRGFICTCLCHLSDEEEEDRERPAQAQ